MTDRAEPGVTPLTAEEIAFAEGLATSPAWPDPENVPVPRPLLLALAREARASLLLAALDAATPRPGLVEALEVSQSVDQQVAGRVEVNQRALLALASGTGEPGLAHITPHPLAYMDQCDACVEKRADEIAAGARRKFLDLRRLANDKGADPTPELK